MLIVPLTRGSTRKFLPVICPIARTTVSISALTKFSVIRLCAQLAETSRPSANAINGLGK
jgi:hypothetical protein